MIYKISFGVEERQKLREDLRRAKFALFWSRVVYWPLIFLFWTGILFGFLSGAGWPVAIGALVTAIIFGFLGVDSPTEVLKDVQMLEAMIEFDAEDEKADREWEEFNQRVKKRRGNMNRLFFQITLSAIAHTFLPGSVTQLKLRTWGENSNK